MKSMSTERLSAVRIKKNLSYTYHPSKTKEDKVAEIKAKRSEGGKKSGETRKAKALAKKLR